MFVLIWLSGFVIFMFLVSKLLVLFNASHQCTRLTCVLFVLLEQFVCFTEPTITFNCKNKCNIPLLTVCATNVKPAVIIHVHSVTSAEHRLQDVKNITVNKYRKDS